MSPVRATPSVVNVDVENDLGREDPVERDANWRPNRSGPASVSDAVTLFATDATAAQFSDGPIADDRVAVRATTEFDQLFGAHYQRLVRALTVVAGDAETASDAVQEAFVKAHLRWKKVSQYDDPIGWVRRVAINQLYDGHRRAGRKQRALAKLASMNESVTRPAEIDEFDRLLAALPKQQRAATALHYVDGLPIAEIAVALGIAEGSVKSHLHDARRRLRPVLEREARRNDHRPNSRERE